MHDLKKRGYREKEVEIHYHSSEASFIGYVLGMMGYWVRARRADD